MDLTSKGVASHLTSDATTEDSLKPDSGLLYKMWQRSNSVYPTVKFLFLNLVTRFLTKVILLLCMSEPIRLLFKMS